MIRIETDRLVIRESSGRDFSRIYAMLLSESRCAGACVDSGEGSQQNTGLPLAHDMPAKSLFYDVSDNEDEELEKYLAYIHTVYSVFGIGLCSVVLNATGEVIGWCGLQPIGDEDSPLGRIELGYLIDRLYRGRGYAFEACSAILRFASQRLEIDSVYARIDGRNTSSVCLAERLGFVPDEGELWKLQP